MSVAIWLFARKSLLYSFHLGQEVLLLQGAMLMSCKCNTVSLIRSRSSMCISRHEVVVLVHSIKR